MDRKTKGKVQLLLRKIDIVEKRIRNILKKCAISNNETLGFWAKEEKELKEEYNILKVIYHNIITYVVSYEYWKKLNQQIDRVKKLKRGKKVNFIQYKKQLVHIRTIKNIINTAYNIFVNSVDIGFKNKINLLSKIQQSIIKVNRIEN